MENTNAKKGMEKNYFENTAQAIGGLQQANNGKTGAQRASGLASIVEAIMGMMA